MRRDPQHDWHWFGLAYAVVFIGLSLVYLAGCATAPEPEPVGNIACWETVNGLVYQAYPLGEDAPTPPEDALVWV